MRRKKRTKPKPELRANRRIRIPELQVVDEKGTQLGVMKTPDALRLAHERGLDLVEVSPHEKPPIAKLMDYGKYKYQKSKEAKEAKAQGKGFKQETKAVRVGFKTGEHDKAFKAKKADQFLQQGHIVKVELTLRGREKAFADMGRQKLLDFIKSLETPILPQGNAHRSPFGWVQLITRDKKAPIPKKSSNNNEIEGPRPKVGTPLKKQPKETDHGKSKDEKSADEAHQDNGDGQDSEA